MITKSLKLALIVFAAGCSAKPYTGQTTSSSTSPDGVTTTTRQARSISPEGVFAGSESELREITANIVHVDRMTRKITLESPAKERVIVTAGPAVRNFDQIHQGDAVRLTYFESMDFEVREPTAEEAKRASTAVGVLGRAPVGSKPGVAVGAEGVSVLTIDEVDTKNNTVTLRGDNGKITVRARHPENLALVKPGNTVVVTVSELLIANVQPIS